MQNLLILMPGLAKIHSIALTTLVGRIMELLALSCMCSLHGCCWKVVFPSKFNFNNHAITFARQDQLS